MMDAETVMLMGTGAASGKTLVGVGLCRALANANVRVAPFKAVSVLRKALDPLTTAYGLAHHCGAARVEFDQRMNPACVHPAAAGSGMLYLNGEATSRIELLGRDQINPRSLDARTLARTVELIQSSLESLLTDYEAVVIEGAGSPIDLPDDCDLANTLVCRLARPPILLSANFGNGGAAASIIGTVTCLPQDVRRHVRGFVLCDINNNDVEAYVSDVIRSHANIELIGTIPHLTLWDGPPETYPGSEESYNAWAYGIVHGLDLARIGLKSLTGS